MIQTLLSAPPHLSEFLRTAPPTQRPATRFWPSFVSHDPIDRRLGSGGGTVNLLWAAWRHHGGRKTGRFLDWLAANPAVVLHAGGESRRLPAYAAIGKALLPVPPLAAGPRRYDQVLADFQLPAYCRVLREAGRNAAVLVASGDVWLDFDALQVPAVTADIAGIGMRVTPEVAQHFGVFFVAKSHTAVSRQTQPIAFFRQKPSPAEIYRHLSRYDFYVDTGLWLLSAEAMRLLFRRCGWNDSRQSFATRDKLPLPMDLYSELGPALGTQARLPRALQSLGLKKLNAAVVPLDDARFFHLGSNRQLFESFEQLGRTHGSAGHGFYTATLHNTFSHAGRLPIWLDGVAGSRSLQLAGLNIVTGKPAEAAPLHLAQEQCLDVAPVGPRAWALRPYALDDTLRGKPGSGATICGLEAAAWLKRRHFPAHDGLDVFNLPLYPIVQADEINQELLDWFFADKPSDALSRRVLAAQRLSAAQIPGAVNLVRYFAQRRQGYVASLHAQFEACLRSGDTRVFAQDFSAIARLCRTSARPLGQWLLAHHRALLAQVNAPEHQSRLLALLGQLATGVRAGAFARQAYQQLQRAIVSSTQLEPSRPKLALKEDQIVWSRSPARLDLAGGWTDTPPYCLEYGGTVLNVAVLLNGQPPIQVFVRPLAEPHISLRSIDLGSSEVITTYAGLASFRDPRSGFSLPKAALALAGFLPEFTRGKTHSTLRRRLLAFGRGLEISLLSAVPKGSGLGTSSILGATLLGALNRACGLGWDEVHLYNRVLALEQLLTTGGGWQDQAGALFRGIKLVQTAPGPAQTPSVRFLPAHLFDASRANHSLLLYYTGMTRLAKGILKEIVEDMFLGRFETLQTLDFIRRNALDLFNVLQQGEESGLHRCIARSWELNKRLDPGTTNPLIERLLARCGPDLAAAKLLGAGGGGYMLLCAPNAAAGERIRQRLERDPPNRRARFIDFQVAERGLEVTVS